MPVLGSHRSHEQVNPSALLAACQGAEDLGAHTARLAECADPGFDKIMPHHVGQEQDAFIDAFGAKVLPQLRSAA